MSKKPMTIQEVAEALKKYKEMKAIASDGEKEMADRLLKMLKADGAKGIISMDGWRFSRAMRVGLKVKKGQEEIAREWAEQNNAIKIDLSAAYQISRRTLKEPDGYERTESEYLTTRTPAGKEKDDQD